MEPLTRHALLARLQWPYPESHSGVLGWYTQTQEEASGGHPDSTSSLAMIQVTPRHIRLRCARAPLESATTKPLLNTYPYLECCWVNDESQAMRLVRFVQHGHECLLDAQGALEAVDRLKQKCPHAHVIVKLRSEQKSNPDASPRRLPSP